MDIKRNYSVETTLTAHQVCQLLTDGKVNDLPINSGKALGIAQDTTGTVMLKGVSKGHSNLTAGVKYYYDSNGILSTTNSGTYIGYAISATELLIPDYIIS